MVVSLTAENIELSVLKKAEKDNDLIVRIYETHGKHASGKLNVRGSIDECDMMEWKKVNNNSNGESQIKIKLTPFEIKTYRIKPN